MNAGIFPLSRAGMFISSTRHFPEGAILNLKFSLALTGQEISTRCEVRHCIPGVGVCSSSLAFLPKPFGPSNAKSSSADTQPGGLASSKK